MDEIWDEVVAEKVVKARLSPSSLRSLANPDIRRWCSQSCERQIASRDRGFLQFAITNDGKELERDLTGSSNLRPHFFLVKQ